MLRVRDLLREAHLDALDGVDHVLEAVEVDDDRVVDADVRERLHRLDRAGHATHLERRVEHRQVFAGDRVAVGGLAVRAVDQRVPRQADAVRLVPVGGDVQQDRRVRASADALLVIDAVARAVAGVGAQHEDVHRLLRSLDLHLVRAVEVRERDALDVAVEVAVAQHHCHRRGDGDDDLGDHDDAQDDTAVTLRHPLFLRRRLGRRLLLVGHVHIFANGWLNPHASAAGSRAASASRVRFPPERVGALGHDGAMNPTEAGPRVLLPGGEVARPAVRRRLLHRGPDHRHLLPALVPGAHARRRPTSRSTRPRPPPRPPASAPASAASPTRRPGSPDWDVAADVAGRAMRLIADGVVEREGVAGLAAHLGYTPRHLNRLLTAELGAGPLALARARRAQTARMLIETTELPFADVAFAAGLLQRPPVQRHDPRGLRQSRRPSCAVAAVAGATTGTVTMRLAVRTPFAGSRAARLPRRPRDPGRGGRGRRLVLPHPRAAARHRAGPARVPDVVEPAARRRS